MINFGNISIRNKLAFVLAIFTLFVVSIVYGLYYFQLKNEISERTFFHLSSVKELKQFQINQKLKDLQSAFKSESFPAFLLKPDEIIFRGEISGDTVIKEYPINIQNIPLEETYLFDLTEHDRNASITLGLLKKNAGKIELAIIHPDLQSVLLERTGLGVSGESYLVGKNKKMLTKSRFFQQKKPTEIVVNSRGVIAGLKGESGSGIFEDYRNSSVFSVYSDLVVSGIHWVILTEMDEQEALQPLKQLNRNLLIILFFIIVFIFILSYLLSAQLTKPLLQVSRHLQDMSKGIYQPQIKLESRKDEIGELYGAFKNLVKAIEQAILFADEIGSGKFNKNFQPLSKEDRLGISLVRMKDRLQAYRSKEKELEKRNQESLIEGQEKERKRLSKEIHDGIGPLITLFQIKIQKIGIAEGNKKELLKLIDDILDELRRISFNLMPSVLIDFGAGEAIRNLLFLIKTEELEINYVYEQNETIHIPEDISILLFRLVQEATNNVLKHSNATKLNITLTEFNDKISLFIKDNGNGFNISTVILGSGIRNMRERVLMKKGTFDIRAGEKGTEIEVEIPLR